MGHLKACSHGPNHKTVSYTLLAVYYNILIIYNPYKKYITNKTLIGGMGAKLPYVEFWAVFIFCSDLPNFCYVSYKLVGKHLSIFCFIGFLFSFEK